MIKGDKISSVFSRCLTSICLAIFEAEDKVIKEKLNQLVNKLLISFISVKNGTQIAHYECAHPNNKEKNEVAQADILQLGKEQVAKYNDIVQRYHNVAQADVLQHSGKNIAKHDYIVQHCCNVAQCNTDIFFAQIDGLISYLELLSHLKKTETASPLLAVKNLLFLKISILNSQRGQFTAKKEIKPKEKQGKNRKTNGLAEEIYDFISKKERPPDNKAIFASFSKFSIRTLRRHIKGLLAGKAIRRHQKGKTVTYTVTR